MKYMRKRVMIHKKKVRTLHLLHEVLTETFVAQPIVLSLLFAQVHCQNRWQWTWLLFSTFYFILFCFVFLFLFLFLEQLGLGFISHAVTSVTNWWHSHKTDHGTWENEVEETKIKWRHTAWITHAGLM